MERTCQTRRTLGQPFGPFQDLTLPCLNRLRILPFFFPPLVSDRCLHFVFNISDCIRGRCNEYTGAGDGVHPLSSPL